MPVNVPQKQPGLTGSIVPAAGAAIGTAYGGPAGGMAGNAAGSAISKPGAQPQGVQTAAIQRRMDALQPAPVDHAADIIAAQDALSYMPPEYQKQYGPTLAAAQARLNGGAA
jgi:hypothetical protein